MREDCIFDNSSITKSLFMPFTVSHTVAVIPLYKYLGKYGAMSPLIIGSMTPDIAYITPFLVHQRMDSHSLIGLYLFCIPMGLTVYFLYHFLMAPVITSVLPKFIQKHLGSHLFQGKLPDIPSHVLVLSLVVGALTHIIWDFFTHETGLPQFIHWMDVPLTAIDGYDIMPYRVLQHFSSLFGLALLVFWGMRWLNRNKNQTAKITHNTADSGWRASSSLKMTAFLVVAISSVLAGVFFGLKHMPETEVMYGLYGAQVFLRFAIVGGATAFLTSTMAMGLYYQYRIRSGF
ncbi:uncharacterized protein DUF4184 [Cocleimonas flava]|uniref:Uncharacterized protein DUF4184 n=2 Tax=Cocleimonas flava TaxID=634765 RepID=A0A4R1F2X7_9GAMM|nr:uncharacterized protein DUF4184 [Cocleimonas flava]